MLTAGEVRNFPGRFRRVAGWCAEVERLHFDRSSYEIIELAQAAKGHAHGKKGRNAMTIDELEKLKPLLPGAEPGGTCRECGAPAVATVHRTPGPGHTQVCATHLEPCASEDVCDCDPTTRKCLHHRRDAAGICLACGPAEAANDERYRRDKERVVRQAKLAIERLGWAIERLRLGDRVP